MIVKKSEIPSLQGKYIPKAECYGVGYPVIPNELIDCMEYLKSDSNESEIGYKILIALLQLRNVFPCAFFGTKHASNYTGYSKKQCEKGLLWLVKKGLMLEKRGGCNARTFAVNYTGLSYTEIIKDIHEQIENEIPAKDVVFKGVRILTTRDYKKEGDGKFIDNFTFVHPEFIPSAILSNGEYKIYQTRFFNQADGNTLKVILKLHRLTNVVIEKRENPEIKIKLDTLSKICAISRNKAQTIVKELITKKYLREERKYRNARSIYFNNVDYRKKVIQAKLSKRAKENRAIVQENTLSSLSISGFLEPVSKPVSNLSVCPSQDLHNKLSFLKETCNDRINIMEAKADFIQENEEQQKTKEKVILPLNSYDVYKANLLDDLKFSRIEAKDFLQAMTILEDYKQGRVELQSFSDVYRVFQERQRVG